MNSYSFRESIVSKNQLECINITRPKGFQRKKYGTNRWQTPWHTSYTRRSQCRKGDCRCCV